MRVLSCSLLSVLMLLAAACGGNASTHTSGNAPLGQNNAAPSGGITVAAAADLKFALDDLLKDFAKDCPQVEVKVSYGSSGNFHTQIANGAPFDLYLSADIGFPRKLIAADLADKDSEFLYAVGRIVIWVPNDSPIDVVALKADSLKHSSISKIAIANPIHAPYGRAAEAVLKKLGMYEAVKDKFVLGENIAQTAQFVESGNAQIGIIAMSLAMAPSMASKGKYWEIPLEDYPRLEQGGCIVSSSKNKGAARALRSYVLGEKGQAVLKRYGFYKAE